LEPDTLTSRRDTDGRLIPRRPQSTSTPAASGAAKRDLFGQKDRHPSALKSVIFRKSRWVAMLAGCFAVVWMAGNSLREPASAQPAERQVSPPRQVSPAPAVATQPPRNGEVKNWFFEDREAENHPRLVE
jgi:hypothetical protein